MIRISTSGGKGGTGKTSIACGLASVLASRGSRVLVVDLDPQSNAGFALGADPRKDGGAADLIAGRAIDPQRINGIAVLVGGPGLLAPDIARADPEELADKLEGLDGFDFVVVDTPPGAPSLERLGLVAADVVLVVLDPHPFSLSGASRVVEDLDARKRKRRKGPKRWALVPSKIDRRRAADREIAADLATMFEDVPVFEVPQDSALASATADRVPLMTAAPHSRAAEALGVIADWIEKT